MMQPNPFVSLLHSRKFLLAVYGVIQTVILHYLDVPADIITAADALIIAVIAGIAYEDNGERRLQSDIMFRKSLPDDTDDTPDA